MAEESIFQVFEPYYLGSLKLKNRFVMAPMCMYSAKDDGLATDFHDNHYLTRAIGGVALIILEATSIEEIGRISEQDLGIWNDKQRDRLKLLVNKLHQADSKVGIQLAHAGRKYGGSIGQAVAPSSIAFNEKSQKPHELSKNEIKSLVNKFTESAIRSEEAGFDLIEIHAAHGYLIHQFLSPLSNKRHDHYGGSLQNRVRFLKEILKEVRNNISKKVSISVRVSASDYCDGGINCDDMVAIINEIKEYIDIVHVSSGGLINVPIKIYPGYQVNFAAKIKDGCNIPTIAVGMLDNIDLAEEIIGNDRSDLIALGRELLRKPYYVLNQARKNNQAFNYPKQYERSFK